MNVIINSSTSFSPSPGTGSSSPIEVTFTGQTTIDVLHNMSAKPIVSVSNNNGQQIFGEIDYPTLNNFTVNFNLPQSGLIRYI